MKIEVPSGKYVVAVSGGVDSMVLLDLMQNIEDIEIIVAHFDHGIRPDSVIDKLFVEKKSKEYGLKFVSKSGNLGASASEETARKARYDFLNSVRRSMNADALITAHHEDDLIETAIINVLRGTNRKGLSSLKSKEGLLRPMLHFSKQEIINFAKEKNLIWHEDSTNEDIKYLRNYIRRNVVSKLNPSQRDKLIKIIETSADQDATIDGITATLFEKNQIERSILNELSYSESKELIAAILREKQIYFDAKTLERLCVELKTKPAGTKLDISGGWTFFISKKQISLQSN